MFVQLIFNRITKAIQSMDGFFNKTMGTIGRGVSLHGCSSKAQPLLLTLNEGYLLTATVPDLLRGMAPLGPPVPAQPPLLGLLFPAAGPGLRLGVAPQGHCPSKYCNITIVMCTTL